jgi:ferredoxin
MLHILERICAGQGEEGDIETLEQLCDLVGDGSLCGLGSTAPNPVLSTLRYFRDEYVAHVRDKRCPARECRGLFRYEIDGALCRGCGLCAKGCPVEAISGEKKKPHVIDRQKCSLCGACFDVCPFSAVTKV